MALLVSVVGSEAGQFAHGQFTREKKMKKPIRDRTIRPRLDLKKEFAGELSGHGWNYSQYDCRQGLFSYRAGRLPLFEDNKIKMARKPDKI